jgi:hypothetical protein
MLTALLFFSVALWLFVLFPSLPMAAVVLAPLIAWPLWWVYRTLSQR